MKIAMCFINQIIKTRIEIEIEADMKEIIHNALINYVKIKISKMN